MARTKAAHRDTAPDDTKSETATEKGKSGHGGSHSSAKLRRVTSSTGTNLRETPKAAAPTSASIEETNQEQSNPRLPWPAFDRDVLHTLRGSFRLQTPTAFTSEIRQWVLSKKGGIGRHSPTMARRPEFRRQHIDQLSTKVRKHFNRTPIQESDVIVNFLHKVQSRAITKPSRSNRVPPPLPDQ